MILPFDRFNPYDCRMGFFIFMNYKKIYYLYKINYDNSRNIKK